MIIKTELGTKRIVLGSVLLLQPIFLLSIGFILYLLPQIFYRDSMNNSKMSCLSI